MPHHIGIYNDYNPDGTDADDDVHIIGIYPDDYTPPDTTDQQA
ncbi:MULTISPECIES: hypothetical protein [unclassified Streptomyces]|nr:MULTISPECIES: hypothetical protein [unclassified Streptomyces]